MKTVTIPTSQSPFVVMVNGAKYVYPAGSVQDVPDEVAVVIEAHNKQTAKPNEPVEAPFDCDCGGGGGAQPDWNQTDSSAADFIKNKPFGDEMVEIMPETEVVGEADGDGVYAAQIDASAFTGAETQIIVTFDGVEYTCPNMRQEFGVDVYGNLAFVGSNDTGEPFCIIPMYGVCAMSDGEPHIVKVVAKVQKTLDRGYVEPCTVLYANPTDNYLYTSDAYDTKVTINNFIDAINNPPVQVKMPTSTGIPALFAPLNAYIDMKDFDCGVVRIMNESEVQTYYTAEYTPAT